ncbi:DUF4202 domain-containing protein [Rubritalea marina]|uniref:DUF4202 domain-containing protein n=1 Tax=Rubritalea marina TaxID=361055 RepID=UPI0003722D88|nr:DUF4202 domain-containing protein [Rubritalea marina]
MTEDALFDQAIDAIDDANAADPRQWEHAGESHPRELWFSKRHYDWVLKLQPNASSALLLAARSQHICRWESPRSDYPMDRPGYLKWRSDLKFFHAKRAAEILAEVGYDQATIDRVGELNLKKNLRKDAECQCLEDALCLTFMEAQFDDLIADTEEDKMIKIVQKTWGKMSEAGHTAAFNLDLSDAAKSIVTKALS